MVDGWEEGEDEGDSEVAEAECVDDDAGFAEGEAAFEKRHARDASPEDTANGDDVRGQQSTDAQRVDLVECVGRADVDKGENAGEDNGENDGVQWDVPALGDGGEPAVEWDTFISSKGEKLSRGGCHVGHTVGDGRRGQ